MTKPISKSDTNSISQTISQTIEKLHGLSTVDVRSHWRCFSGEMSVSEVFASDFSLWDATQLNEKGHIAWEKGRMVLWLAQKIVVPQDLQGYPLTDLCLRLALVWWTDSTQVYINGSLVAQGDLFDFSQRVLLSQKVRTGEEFTVALRLVSPGHDNGALVSSSCVYEAVGNNLYPGFVASELAIAQRYCEAFGLDELDDIAEVINRKNWEEADKDGNKKELIDKSLIFLISKLKQSKINASVGKTNPSVGKTNPSVGKIQNPKQTHPLLKQTHPLLKQTHPLLKSKISLVGHAHLDMAWLWRVSETWSAAKNTFNSVLSLQKDFPELIFCHSTPALYAWVEENCPDLFEQIQQAVKNQVWEVVGCFWVEPELNIISGESIVRQLLYGQRYVKEKFGAFSTVAWLPDSFGFCWTLPQFMVSAGVKYFVTQKLIWNDTTKFPHGAFWWRSPDGSEIFSLMSAPIGEGIDPVKMVEYAIAWEKQTGLQNYLWLPGVGDHGGGPTRDMLEIARRWQGSSVCPQFEFTTVENYLKEILNQETRGQGDKVEISPPLSSAPFTPLSPPSFLTWNDELYLEFHRGCYTTHGDQKLYNRRGENLLYEAELFATLATICCDVEYPQAEIEASWKKLLFNQFHDILPGSSIPEVYQDAEPEWQYMESTASNILNQSLETLTAHIDLPRSPHPDSLPVVVFNSLNWSRSQVVSVSLPTNYQQWQVHDAHGNQIISQVDESGKLLFLARNIPAVGYNLFWLSPITEIQSQQSEKTIALELIQGKNPSQSQTTEENKNLALEFIGKQSSSQEQNKTLALELIEGKKSSEGSEKTIALELFLENEFLRVVIDEQTGDLSRVFDKINNREILSGQGNQIQAFTDKGQYWDAWNIDPNYCENILPRLQLKSIKWQEKGLLQNRLRVVRQLGESEFIQDYILQAGSSILKIATQVNWLERHVLVKAAFPLNLEADFATYEIPCGAIQRTTKPTTAAEKAKWEVPALRWADLTEQGDREINGCYGVSLLNDCKYGYDATPNQLRISLLRSPEWPNPEADKGFHEFSYGIYPHGGSWEKAETVKRGYEFNRPLKVVVCERKGNIEASTESTSRKFKDKASFIDISAENLILMAFKPTEDNPQEFILRCYECHGQTAEIKLTGDIGLSVKESVDLLERPQTKKFAIAPWKIASFRVGSE